MSLNLVADPTMPPTALLSEGVVLGAMVWHGPKVAVPLLPEDFYPQWHRDLFTLICELHARRPGAVDLVAVIHELVRCGMADRHAAVIDYFDQAAGAHPRYHVEQILDAAEARLVQTTGQTLAACGGDVDRARVALSDAGDDLAELRSRALDEDRDLTRLDSQLTQAVKRYAGIEAPAPVPTGLTDLDTALGGGLRPGSYTVLGGQQGTGKSMLAASVARNVAELPGSRVLYLTMELTDGEVTDRLLANIARIDLGRLQSPSKLTDGDWLKIDEAMQLQHDWNLHVVDGPHTIGKVGDTARTYLAGAAPGLLVVDYIGRVSEDGTAPNRERHVAMVSNTLKDLALDLRIAVLAVASLSREVVRRGGRPRAADLRDSGNVEYDADAVLLLWQAKLEDRDTVDVVVDKNRFGPQTEFQLIRQGQLARMVSAVDYRWTPGSALRGAS